MSVITLPKPPAPRFVAMLGIGSLLILGASFVYQENHRAPLGLLGVTRDGVQTSGSYGYGTAPSYAGRAVEDEYYARDMDKSIGGVSMPPIAPIPTPTPSAPLGQAKMVRTAQLQILVADTDETLRGIEGVRIKYGGTSGSSYFTETKNGLRQGTITIWVPSDKLDAALADIRTLAIRVEVENISADDISSRYADLSARLRNARATEAQYLEIMKRSGEVKDILAVAQALAGTRGEIESLQGMLNELDQRVDLSSVQISITPEASPKAEASEWHPSLIAKEAFSGVVRDLKTFAGMLIAGVIGLLAVLPQLAFYVLILWLLFKLGKKLGAKFFPR